jgi:tetratricopeptide (TPR) repeat protein
VADARTDEVRLGEELFAVHELLESEDFDAALEKGMKLAADNPGSASAHAIVARVCERRAEDEWEDGDPAKVRGYLKLAISCYESIIDLNPDSAADREKLASLRLKYTGHVAAAPKVQMRPGFAEAMRSVPKPAIAATAAFVMMIALVIIFTSSPGAKRGSVEATKAPGQSEVTVTPSAPAEQPSLSVYTFPQANTSSAPAAERPIPRAPKPSEDASVSEVRPMKVPKIDQELTLVPEPKATKKPAAEPAKASESKQPASSSPSGGTLLAQAIRLHDQGKPSEAIGAANQAIVLYNADIEAGKSVDAARRGVANANKLISVWQQSMNTE